METATAVEIDKGRLRQLLPDDSHKLFGKAFAKTAPAFPPLPQRRRRLFSLEKAITNKPPNTKFRLLPAYQRSVEAGLREGVRDPWEHLKGQVILGEQEFVESLAEELRGDRREQPSLRGLRARPRWQEIVKVIEGMKQARWGQFRDQRGDWGRDVALSLGRLHGGLKLRELGALVGVDYGAVSVALKRLEQQRQRDPRLARRLREAENLLLNV